MGSGDRFNWDITRGLLFGVTVERFPFSLVILLSIGPVWLSYGFGRRYDE